MLARRQRGDAVSGYLLISPAMALLILFILIPALWIFWLSFQRWDLISGSSDFIATANYERLLLRDDVFRKAVWQTLYFVAGTVPRAWHWGSSWPFCSTARCPFATSCGH